MCQCKKSDKYEVQCSGSLPFQMFPPGGGAGASRCLSTAVRGAPVLVTIIIGVIIIVTIVIIIKIIIVIVIKIVITTIKLNTSIIMLR